MTVVYVPYSLDSGRSAPPPTQWASKEISTEIWEEGEARAMPDRVRKVRDFVVVDVQPVRPRHRPHIRIEIRNDSRLCFTVQRYRVVRCISRNVILLHDLSHGSCSKMKFRLKSRNVILLHDL